MKPFNLADALTKEPVQLRNGLVATVVADFINQEVLWKI